MFTPADLTPVDATSIKLQPSHPGFGLAEEIEFRGYNANSMAKKLKMPRNRLAAIMAGKRAITADTALRLERGMGLSANFYMRLQASYDLAIADRENGSRIAAEVKAYDSPHLLAAE